MELGVNCNSPLTCFCDLMVSQDNPAIARTWNEMYSSHMPTFAGCLSILFSSHLFYIFCSVRLYLIFSISCKQPWTVFHAPASKKEHWMKRNQKIFINSYFSLPRCLLNLSKVSLSTEQKESTKVLLNLEIRAASAFICSSVEAEHCLWGTCAASW